MSDGNLFTMLSAYRPGAAADPFENYCTSGLAYFLERGQRMLTALFAQATGAYGEALALVEVQPELPGAGFGDLVLTFEGGKRALVEVRIDAASDLARLEVLGGVGRGWPEMPTLIELGLPGGAAAVGWERLSWLDVVDALDRDPDPMSTQYNEFVLRDILGLGQVPLDEAIATNRLYALGGAALRKRFGTRVSYVNSSSRPVGGRYRYLGTTFSLDGGEMEYWAGLVNETVPLGEHYHLMLASKTRPVARGADHPRATGDWKWSFWTGMGRVVRPIEPAQYDELVERLEA